MILPYLKLAVAALVPVAVSAILIELEKKTDFDKRPYKLRQAIIGIIFGLISIMGTEWGIPINGVVVNSRDAAPLIAGLLFGSPAGIIAGLMGGIERWFAVYWGIGTFTRVACSVSTVLAGFFAAFLRRFMFENKKPTWGLALGSGIVMEVFHLCMVFVTNIKDATKAIYVVDTCFIPMVTSVGISVMLSTLISSIILGEFRKGNKVKSAASVPIFETIQKWLLIVLTICFTVSMAFMLLLERNMTKHQSETVNEATISEVGQDIRDNTDEYMIKIAWIVGREISYGNYDINALIDRYSLTDIHVIDKNGIIIDSNEPDFIGFDMKSGEQSAEFMCLIDEVTEYVQPYGPLSIDPSIQRKYAGVQIRNGFIQIGYDAEDYQREVNSQIAGIARNRHVGQNGAVIIFEKDNRIISASRNLDSIKLTEADINFLTKAKTPTDYILENDKTETLYSVETLETEGYKVSALFVKQELTDTMNVSLYVSLFCMILMFAILFGLIYFLVKAIVVNQISQMANSLSVICDGNLNEVVDVRSSSEFASLSDDINYTVDTLKRYIDEAAARIDKELEFAKAIQSSALPNPKSYREEYDIYAIMDAAKEVGGDFFDFYTTDNDILNFLIADVSGKGIPAAMFMMQAKSVLKSCTESGLKVNDVFCEANNRLCEGNEAEMFVTAWQGTLDLKNGNLQFANAGHNLPVIKHKDGKFEYMDQKRNFVLAGMEDIPYSINDYKLEKGDIIFLYTDGVTEATNSSEELFGEDRLLESLNSFAGSSLKELCEHVMESIDGFVLEADQFDDITMLALEYKG